MAEALAKFDGFGRHPGGSRYPWDEWLDGRIWKLTEGVDYQSAEALRAAMHSAVRTRGLKARARIVDGRKAIVIQAYKP